MGSSKVAALSQLWCDFRVTLLAVKLLGEYISAIRWDFCAPTDGVSAVAMEATTSLTFPFLWPFDRIAKTGMSISSKMATLMLLHPNLEGSHMSAAIHITSFFDSEN